MRRGFGFLKIRRDQRGAGVARQMRNLGIDDQRARRLDRDHRFDQPPGHHALQVVGHQQSVRTGRASADARGQRLLDAAADLVIVLVVDACDLLVPIGDNADFFRSRPGRILDQSLGADPCGRELPPHRRRGAIRADDPDQGDPRAERREIVRDVRRPAEPHVLRVEAHHRDRRFRRDPRHPADEEPVEHDIAGDKDPHSGEPRHDSGRAAAVDWGQDHRRGGGTRTAAAAGRARPVSPASAANGSVIRIRNSIRNSESPKLYSNMPAESIAATVASAAAVRNRCRRA